ncbi:MAG: caspase family protein [Pseudomonadota bacterium]
MRIWTIVSAFLLMVLGTASAGLASTGDQKVALVIGNGAYQNAPDLPNPPNDARAMATLLRSMGFTVIEGIDVDKQAMSGLIDKFTETAYEADLGLVFYAGHGMQVSGKNYLIPVDAELTSPAHLRTRAIEISSLVDSLPPDPNIGVVILDACRDNPLARTLARSLPATRSSSIGTGLAPVQVASQGDGTGGTLIAYSTDPGAVALDGENTQNSPYTKALIKHLATPGIELQAALTRVRGEVARETEGRQRPWHNASLGREVFLGSSATPVATATPSLSIQSATDQKNTEVAALPSASDTAAPTVRTQNDQKAWEVESRFWDEATKRNTLGHYEAYLTAYPEGKFAKIAALNIEQLKATETRKTEAEKMAPATSVHAVAAPTRHTVGITDEMRATPGTVISEEAIGLNRAARRDLQKRLNALGHKAGSADGVIGPNSRKAIGSWQKANGIVETQMLTPNQWAVLKNQSEPLMEEIRKKEAAAAAAAAARKKASRDAARKRQATRPRSTTRTRTRTQQTYTPPPRYSNPPRYTNPSGGYVRPQRNDYRRPATGGRYSRERRGSGAGAFVGGAVLGAGAAIVTCKAVGGC